MVRLPGVHERGRMHAHEPSRRLRRPGGHRLGRHEARFLHTGDRVRAGRIRGHRVQTWPRPTLLVKSRWSSSKDIEVNVTSGTTAVLLAFSGYLQDPFSARFGLTQQSHDSPYIGGEFRRLAKAHCLTPGVQPTARSGSTADGQVHARVRPRYPGQHRQPELPLRYRRTIPRSNRGSLRSHRTARRPWP
jgi:hypothetical protein